MYVGPSRGVVFASTLKATDRSYLDISYQMNYVEENFRKAIKPWSFRHTGVYHHHTAECDLFILLHPNENSILDTRLLGSLGIDRSQPSHTSSAAAGISSFLQNPACLHSFVLSSFLENWRWYLRDLGNKFEYCVCTVWARSLSHPAETRTEPLRMTKP
jgi:hypothetical protein